MRSIRSRRFSTPRQPDVTRSTRRARSSSRALRSEARSVCRRSSRRIVCPESPRTSARWRATGSTSSRRPFCSEVSSFSGIPVSSSAVVSASASRPARALSSSAWSEASSGRFSLVSARRIRARSMASRSMVMTLTFVADVGMRASELDYELPPELIAQRPLERRDESRLLVYDRATAAVEHARFSELPQLLAPQTLVAVNDTRVMPARLLLERPTGGKAEVLLLERVDGDVWEALARPSRRLRAGTTLGPVELLEPLGEGRWRVRLEGEPEGQAPLPPHINEPLADPAPYPTVDAAEARP